LGYGAHSPMTLHARQIIRHINTPTIRTPSKRNPVAY
jgi:hypothetical protein